MADLLTVQDIYAGYGAKEVVHGASLSIGRGEVVALIGHNGAGKSTLLKATFGVLPLRNGRVLIDEHAITEPSPATLISSGIVYLPQGNQVFTELTVIENIELRSIMHDRERRRLNIQQAVTLFPALKAKLGQRAGLLSGGEKQMLALAGALTLRPRLLLLDEPSLGLSPNLVRVTFDHLRSLARDFNLSMLIAEQRIREVLSLSQRVYIMRRGSIAFAGPAAALNDERRLIDEYFK